MLKLKKKRTSIGDLPAKQLSADELRLVSGGGGDDGIDEFVTFDSPDGGSTTCRCGELR